MTNLYEMAFKIIDNHNIYEMAKIGNFNECEVIIFTNDPGNIPHCHIRDISTNGDKFHCCVRLDKAEYFLHTGKEDKLNAEDKKDFINFLNSKSSSTRFKTFTNWEVLLALWNMNNSNIIIDENQKMPDYKNLK